MKKKAKTKVVSKEKPKSVKKRVYRTSEDEYHFNELKRKADIKDEILDFLRFRNDYVVIDETDDYFVVAKFAYLSIQNKYNESGFQPVDKIHSTKECLLRVIEFGEEPNRDTLAYLLKRGGCPVIKINTKFDVESRLDK